MRSRKQNKYDLKGMTLESSEHTKRMKSLLICRNVLISQFRPIRPHHYHHYPSNEFLESLEWARHDTNPKLHYSEVRSCTTICSEYKCVLRESSLGAMYTQTRTKRAEMLKCFGLDCLVSAIQAPSVDLK